MQALVHLPALRSLRLYRTCVRGEAISLLAQLPGLRVLDVDFCACVSGSCLQALPSLTQLHDLKLDTLDCPKIQVRVC